MTPRNWTPGRPSAATSTSTATASPSAPARHASDARRLLHPRHHASDRYARYSERGSGLHRQHAAAAAQVRDRARLVPQPCCARPPSRRAIGVICTTAPPARRCTRRWTLEAEGLHLDALRVRAFPFPRRWRLHRRARPGLRRRAEPRRADAHCCSSTNSRSTRPGWCRCCTTTARRSPRASSRQATAIRGARSCSNASFVGPRCGGRMTYRSPSHCTTRRCRSNQARLHPARLRGPDLDAVRRLRPRLDLGGDHPGLLGARHRAAPRGQALGHRLLVEDADYFLGASHGFNTVHGRMPSVLTGANLANRDLIYLGVSGDGDSASIGLGQFAHAMRRGVNMVYIVENNGVYGLTKGQFSATADRGSKQQEGRGQHRRADRPGGAGAAARRHLRRAQLLRRQGAARAADQGRDRAPAARPSST
jgi:hypothetical protein